MMWICPICDKRNYSNSVCSQCGFDSSVDYERFPTAAPVDLDTAKTIFKKEYKRIKGYNRRNRTQEKASNINIFYHFIDCICVCGYGQLCRNNNQQ